MNRGAEREESTGHGRGTYDAAEEFQCVLIGDGNGTMKLCDGSASFYARMGITKESRGQDVGKIIEGRAETLLWLIREMSAKTKLYGGLIELEDGLWEVMGINVAPYIYLRARKNNAEELAQRYGCARALERSERYAPGFRSMLVQRTETGEYQVLSCNRAALEWKDENGSLKKEWSEAFALMRGEELLHACARQGAGLCVEDVESRGGRKRFVKLMCLPMGQGAGALLVVCVESTREAFMKQHRWEESDVLDQPDGDRELIRMLKREKERLITGESADAGEKSGEEMKVHRFAGSAPAPRAESRREEPESEESGPAAVPMARQAAGLPAAGLVRYQFPKGLLTRREEQVLTLALNNFTNRGIAAELKIMEGTVKKTVFNGYRKLGVRSRVELCNLFIDTKTTKQDK